MKIKILLIVAALIGITTLYLERHYNSADAVSTNIISATKAVSKPAEIKNAGQTAIAKSTAQPEATVCTGLNEPTIVVSLRQQHLWACTSQKLAYDSAVTTGATAYGDGTPTGTWKVYSKQTNRYLTGSDDRGSWNDFVNYWMPFYGSYGFHDASWQTFPFGSLTDYQTGGSHGCVHVPLSAMKWLFDWSSIGTTVTIKA